MELLSLALCLGISALTVFLALRLGRRSVQDATVFFWMEGDRLFAVDARSLVYHGRDILSHAAAMMEVQQFLQKLAENPYLPAGADEIRRVERIRENRSHYALVCQVRHPGQRTVRRTYFLVKGLEDQELLLRQLERRKSWENDLDAAENRNPFFILLSALACGGNSLEDLGALCDAFYIGGTKNGALFGEAVCIMNPALKPDFRYILKQHGGMLAKGWLLGVQFEQLMQNGLFEQLGEHSTRLARQLTEGLKDLGVEFMFESPSNQIFPILPDEVLKKLEGAFHWEVNAELEGGRSCVRLVCSWATEEAAVTAFLLAVEGALKDCPACM